jgi:ribosome recycling factor
MRDEGEQSKVAIRNIRRDANHDVKMLIKDKEINEDEGRRLETEIQKLTDGYIVEVDSVLQRKETDLMEI